MARRPAVTVATCLLDSSRFIAETLDSVFAQTFQDFEIVLVDDGSIYGCVELIERRYADGRIRIPRDEHRGLSAARRQSRAAASADFIAFLDHDNRWVPPTPAPRMPAASA